MGTIKFKAKSSETLGLIIQAPPTYLYPERDTETKHIPGRNGDLVIDNKCFKNSTIQYNIAKVFPSGTTYFENALAISEWLHTAEGDYAKLEDSYESDVFRMARYSESNQFTNVYDQALTGTISFECKPQRYLNSGLTPISITSRIKVITPPTIYPALPKISITGYSTEPNEYLIMSIDNVSSGTKEVTSLITINDVAVTDTITIDSDAQRCYDSSGNDCNEKIGLNGLSFPVLKRGTNNLMLYTYVAESVTVDKYSKLITENETVCKSEYKTKDDLIGEQQKLIKVRSYQDVIDSHKKKFDAPSYQAYASQLCESTTKNDDGVILGDSYTFESFNKILEQTRKSWTVYSNYNENSQEQTTGGGNGYIRVESSSGGDVSIIAVISGFYMVSNEKYIKYITANGTIGTVKSSESTATVYYWPCDGNHLDYSQVTYSDIPSWIGFNVTTVDVTGIGTILNTLEFVVKANTGYYWTDKTWIFGKPAWRYQGLNQVIGSMKWSSLKKAFMPTTGISTSTTLTTTFKFMQQWSNFKDNEFFDITFNVVSPEGDEAFTTCYYKAKKAGYYSYRINDDESTKTLWSYKNVGDTIAIIPGTSSIQLEYLSEVPTYVNEEGFPDWLDPTPVTISFTSLKSDSSITFTVKESAKYRYSYIQKDDDGNEQLLYTTWVDMEANTNLNLTAHPKTISDSFQICKINEDPAEYAHNRCYTTGTWQTVTDGDGNESTTIVYSEPSENPPAFLSATFTLPTDDNPVGEVAYKANAAGYFKWDSNSAWLLKAAGDDLMTSGYQDNTTFYYMASLPSYSSYSKYSYAKVACDANGNPDVVTIKAKLAGYFRVNYNSDWVSYSKDDILYEGTVNEQIKVSSLQRKGTQPKAGTIKIIPNWWTL